MSRRIKNVTGNFDRSGKAADGLIATPRCARRCRACNAETTKDVVEAIGYCQRCGGTEFYSPGLADVRRDRNRAKPHRLDE